ncbi:unnamed protein product [Trichogramma brassicae]|uniref:Uncharacterized protein n=1 Tax=Trichogramma brassicae TaxID=86971 RepID=A0A6H5IHC7_9HYME|nr:unnamed protein product [Trichogramma brassicae]
MSQHNIEATVRSYFSEKVFTGARSVTRCTRSTECALTLFTQSDNLLTMNVLEEVLTGARSVTWCTRSTKCGLTLFIQSAQPNNNECSRRSLHRGQIGDPVHQVDGMWFDTFYTVSTT